MQNYLSLTRFLYALIIITNALLKVSIMFDADLVDLLYWLKMLVVTDGQTDRWTDRHTDISIS